MFSSVKDVVNHKMDYQRLEFVCSIVAVLHVSLVLSGKNRVGYVMIHAFIRVLNFRDEIVLIKRYHFRCCYVEEALSFCCVKRFI